VKFVIFDALGANWLKGPQAYVERYVGRLDPALPHAIEDFRCEMKTRGGGRNRPARVGVNRLITLAISRRIGARDIGRQGNVPDAVKDPEEIRNRLEPDATLAEFRAGQNFSLQLTGLAEK
jgi:hypothetical protein